MASLVPITKLQELLGLAKGTEIESYETENLTSAFENYGSLMLALKVTTIHRTTKQKNVINLVCKLYPPSEHWREMFQIDRTFEKEMKLYTVVVPELLCLQQELNISEEYRLDIFVKCHGARLQTFDGDQVVEAAMVMDNIKLHGFKMLQRSEGFNKNHVQVLLKKIALFHAVPLALRLQKPKAFEEKVMPVIQKVDLNQGLEEKEKNKLKQMFQEYFEADPEISHLKDKVLKQIDYCWEQQANPLVTENPFNSICHNDLWVNNMMVKYATKNEETPHSVKILDFQLTKFAPVTLDLLFFLITSVQFDFLKESFDDLLKEYFEQFIKILKAHSSYNEDFSYEAFLASLDQVAVGELYHLLILLRLVHLDKSKVPVEEQSDSEVIFRPEIVGDNFYRKLNFLLLEYERRGWLIDSE